ncbi:MAG: hypothetical protein HZY75_11770 [Nocardioidaceae bacterium]|nr:MAG: hypothetical protein HZY75_11770 [Nocardioidaceae bacterium]
MTGWIRTVLRELRRGTPLFAFVLFAVLVGVLLWSHSAYWGTRWNQLGVHLRDNFILLAPLAVALGVWQGGRSRRSGVGELHDSTRRSALIRHSSEVVALTVAAYAGALVGLASAGWTILVTGGYGLSIALLYVAGLLPALLSYSALGFLIGRWLSWRVAAPVAGVVSYLVLGFVLWNDDKRAVTLGGGWLGGTEIFAFDLDGLMLSSLGLLIVAIGLLALGSAERRPAAGSAWLTAGVVGAVSTILLFPVTVAAVESGSTDYPEDPDPDLACTADDGPRVCLLAEHRHLLDEATTQAREVLTRFEGIDGAPTRAGPPRRDPASRPSDMLPTTGGDVTPWGDPDERWGPQAYVNVWGFISPTSYCHTDEGGLVAGDPGDMFDPRVELVAGWVEQGNIGGQWLRESFPKLAGLFTDATDAQRRDFAGRVIAASRACDPTAAVAADNALRK